MRHPIIAALLGAALLAVAGCGSDDGADSGSGGRDGASTTPAAADAAASTDTIRIADFLYKPDPASVKAEQAITVRNDDRAPHTLTDAGSGRAFDSGTIKGKATGAITIDAPGTYKIFCELHPTMSATITVTP